MSFTIYFAISALFQLYATDFSLATEPVCSKFSYEEKLLEKMIRTEIKVETIHNEIKKTEETVRNTLVEIKNTALEIHDKFESFRNNLTGETAAQIKALEEKEDQLENIFDELKINLTMKVGNEMDSLAKLKETVLQPSIAFHVHNVKDFVLDTTNEVLVFESIITNEGSGYDKTTGIFTAPIAGVFFFSVHVCTTKAKFSPIGLVLNGTFIAKSVNRDDDNHTCGSVSAIVKMKPEGKVWVTCTASSSTYVLKGDDANHMNTFSGMLISK
ncbi:complement C1q tumor necrosis factor-related protein 5-like [Ruditapes philippinarum]|uniref:complement C1q tumor necrosis factor-related protein 5-like n=1 Tax=Ruditapes philippinarum TaxID=129788 RepID=UPI00295B2A2A|nr:complement C1q tumor necrosis factor-related protein 5-like [Ruditapes philippinarum]